jgi:hypothetical protein
MLNCPVVEGGWKEVLRYIVSKCYCTKLGWDILSLHVGVVKGTREQLAR